MAVVLSREEWESEKIFLESFVEWYEPHFLEKLDELARKSGEYFVSRSCGGEQNGLARTSFLPKQCSGYSNQKGLNLSEADMFRCQCARHSRKP